MNNTQAAVGQEIRITDRARLTITAVEDVMGFDETNVIVKTRLGTLAVDGRDLRITELSVETGELFIEGVIGGVVFFEETETKKRRGLFKS